MGFSLDIYKTAEKGILNDLKGLLPLMKAANAEKLSHELEERIGGLKNTSFKIVVVGEFSRGKSTFINALLGESILPSTAKPTTTILNSIFYKPEKEFKLIFHNATIPPKTLSEEAFRELTAPQEPDKDNPEAVAAYADKLRELEGISHAEIGYPLAFCKDGVELIDTPGTNEMNTLREQLTNSIIPKADTAIYLLSGAKPLSASDLRFLKNSLLKNDIQKIFIVVNKKDEFRTVEDEEQVKDYIHSHLDPVLGKTRVYLVSSLQALYRYRADQGERIVKKSRGREIEIMPWDRERTGFPSFTKELADFLQFDRGRIRLQKPVIRTVQAIDKILKNTVAANRKVLKLNVEILEKKAEGWRNDLRAMRADTDEAIRRMRMMLDSETDDVLKWHRDRVEDLAADIEILIIEQAEHLGAAALENKINDYLAAGQRTLFTEGTEMMKKTIGKMIRTTVDDVSKKWDTLKNDVAVTLHDNGETGVTESGTAFQLTGEEPGMLETLFDTAMDKIDEGFDKSTNMFDKIFYGAAFIVTGVAGLVGSLLKALFGPPRPSLKENAMKSFHSNLHTYMKERIKTADERWETIWVGSAHHMESQLREHIADFEQQINVLLKDNRLEQTETDRRLKELAELEYSLLRYKASLSDKLNKIMPQEETVH